MCSNIAGAFKPVLQPCQRAEFSNRRNISDVSRLYSSSNSKSMTPTVTKYETSYLLIPLGNMRLTHCLRDAVLCTKQHSPLKELNHRELTLDDDRWMKQHTLECDVIAHANRLIKYNVSPWLHWSATGSHSAFFVLIDVTGQAIELANLATAADYWCTTIRGYWWKHPIKIFFKIDAACSECNMSETFITQTLNHLLHIIICVI